MARQVVDLRREAERQVSLYPTMSELAAQLGCTPRYLQKVLAGKARQR
jgi:AraC-like DNA-binding protein